MGLHITLMYGALSGWSLNGCDCRNAYLQSDLDREVPQIVRLPSKAPFPPGCKPGELRVSNKAIYGSSNSGRQWWLHFKKIISENGGVELRNEPGVYVWRDLKGEPVMLFHTHVDDVLAAVKQVPEVVEKLQIIASKVNALDSLIKIFKPYRPLGREIRVEGSYVVVCQDLKFTSGADLSGEAEYSRPLDDEEITMYRSYVGQLLWYSRSTMPELSCRTNCLARAMSSPTVGDYVQAQKVIQRMKGSKGEVRFPTYKHLSEIVLIAYVDAAFANAEDKSVMGVSLAAAPRSSVEHVIKGDHKQISPLAWSTATTKRVARSTLLAETHAASEGAELAAWTRAMLLEVKSGYMPSGATPAVVGDHELQVILLSDSNGLMSAITNTSSDAAANDKRARINIKHLGQMIRDPYECRSMRWISIHAQVADPLTKDLDTSLLTMAKAAKSGMAIMQHRHDKNKKKNAHEVKEVANATYIEVIKIAAIAAAVAAISTCICMKCPLPMMSSSVKGQADPGDSFHDLSEDPPCQEKQVAQHDARPSSLPTNEPASLEDSPPDERVEEVPFEYFTSKPFNADAKDLKCPHCLVPLRKKRAGKGGCF